MSKKEVRKPPAVGVKKNDLKSPRAGTTIQELEWSRPHIQFMSQILRKTYTALGLEDSEIDPRLQNLQDLCTSANGYLLLPPRGIKIMSEVQADIQQYLKDQTKLRWVIKVQSLVRRWLVLEKFKDLTSSELYNVKIYNKGIMELIKTERVYVGKLAHLFNHVVSPLRKMETDTKQKHPVALNKGDVQTLFWNMEQILRLHMYLLQSMETVVKKSWPFCEHLAEPFTKLIPSFGLYGDYVEHYQAAKEKLKELQKQSKFNAFLQEKNIDPNMMLMLPLNRIPDYNLMLEGLVQKSPFENQEASELVLVQTIIKESANLINQKLEHSEHVAVNDRIQKSIVNFKGPALNMEKNRVFQKEIFFGKKYLFLFNDLILVCTPLKKGYEMLGSSDWESIELADLPDASGKFGFEIKMKGLLKPIQLYGKNKEEKASIFEELNRIMTDKKIRVFGKDLHLLLRTENRNSSIPIVVEMLVTEIQNRGLTTEGIFRVEGGSTDVQKLRRALDKNPKHPIGTSDIYELGQVLKQYFRELPVPLIPFEYYSRLIGLQKDHTVRGDVVQFLEQLRLFLKELSPPIFNLLQYLAEFLGAVSRNSDKNKMNSQNLGIVFGPNLIRPREQTFQTSVDIPLVYTIVQSMIDFRKYVFGSQEIVPSMLEAPSPQPTKEDKPIVVVARRTVTKFKTSTLTHKEAYAAMTSRLKDLPWDEETTPASIKELFRGPDSGSDGSLDGDLSSNDPSLSDSGSSVAGSLPPNWPAVNGPSLRSSPPPSGPPPSGPPPGIPPSNLGQSGPPPSAPLPTGPPPSAPPPTGPPPSTPPPTGPPTGPSDPLPRPVPVVVPRSFGQPNSRSTSTELQTGGSSPRSSGNLSSGGSQGLLQIPGGPTANSNTSGRLPVIQSSPRNMAVVRGGVSPRAPIPVIPQGGGPSGSSGSVGPAGSAGLGGPGPMFHSHPSLGQLQKELFQATGRINQRADDSDEGNK